MTQKTNEKTTIEIYEAIATAELNNAKNIAQIKALDAIRAHDNAMYGSLKQAERLHITKALAQAMPNKKEFLQTIEDGKFLSKKTLEAMKQI